MKEEFVLKEVSKSQEPLIDVVFVHGLSGDPITTWENGDKEGFWPSWIHTDIGNVNVYTLGYPTSVVKNLTTKEMDVFERAASSLEYLASSGFGVRPIAFIAHSLGGLLTKVILRKAQDSTNADYKRIATATRLCVFIATPHTGASIANVVSLLKISSTSLKLLGDESGYLKDLKSHYQNFADNKSDLETVSYYEKHKTKPLGVIVSRASADTSVSGVEPIAVEKNHIEICKPRNTDDPLYRGVIHRLNKIVLESASLVIEQQGIELNYGSPSQTDRRELLQKLIDANREHEYSYVNESQYTFARKFMQIGLYTSARESHEALLAEIETRFITHVYHPLICKNETDGVIRKALQDNVIDPVASLQFKDRKFTAKQVLDALYFLTEQCHIRWDAKT